MSKRDSSGMVMALSLIVSVLAGILSWNIVAPESFLGGIGFMLLWSAIASVGYLIIFVITANK